MKKEVVKVQIEMEWAEANILPNLEDDYELEYHREQFNRGDFRRYMLDIYSHFLDKPNPVYMRYWREALQPPKRGFRLFKNYFTKNGFEFSDDRVYHKLYFTCLILWRNFAYNGSEKSNKVADEFYQAAVKFHNEKMGYEDTKRKHRKLLDKKREGKELDVVLGKKGVKDGSRARSYIYWVGKLFGPLSKFDNVTTEERVINLIGLLFCTATDDFQEKYKSYLEKETSSKQKKKWKKYLYDSIRSYKNRHPEFAKESLKGVEYILRKLKARKDINLSDPEIPAFIIRKMKWRREDRKLTNDEIEIFIATYSRHRPRFNKAGIWPWHYDNSNSKVRRGITLAKHKAKRKFIAELEE